ncbi:MAG: hypothetical protein QNJ22_01660 [Desulfosarcinaceae bacterium]|nr:hypothetical protein [Desulfosarcinaceae bacterium]
MVRCAEKHPHADPPSSLPPRRIPSAYGSLLVVLFAALLLLACEPADETTTSAADNGQVIIGLTDASGDFLTYTVEVVSLQLERANGAVVETLPTGESTTVDFSQYVELTEFFTAASVPLGTYTAATLTLDYSDADIQVEDADGDAVAVGGDDILDAEGQPAGELVVTVHLEDRSKLTVLPGVPAHLTLDFDLQASNDVDMTGATPVVTVQPVLLAEVDAEAPKPHRVRGPLKSVDTADQRFTIIIRPFIHLLSGGEETFGTLLVTTDADTVFEIDGESYAGAEGLTVLDAKPALTATTAVGELVIRPTGRPRFTYTATAVYAGSSVPGGDLDVVTGNVAARVGDLLTVKGATLIRANGSAIFNDTLDVQLGARTVVSRQLSAMTGDIDDISVGQRVTAFGVLSGDTTVLDTSDDASPGHVRLHLTTLNGRVAAFAPAQAETFQMDLDRIDGRAVRHFDFTGTGQVADADPEAYEVDRGSLTLTALSGDAPIKVKGFVTPFGHGSGVADFSAQTVVNVAAVKGLLYTDWWPSNANAVQNLDSDSFRLNFAGTGPFHTLWRSGVATDLTSLSETVEIQARSDGNGLFSLIQNGERQAFLEFTPFSDELGFRLAAQARVQSIVATGSFDDATADLTADLVTIRLN